MTSIPILFRRRLATRYGLELVALYTPPSPSLLPVYGPHGEIVGWTLP